MNEARLEELKKILNERRQNLEQGSLENSDAQNFDIPNSDASDLNSSNSEILNFNDKNSDRSNSNAKDDSKFQNLYSSQATSNKNSKTQARDYDKEPIVIKNYEEAYQVLLKMVPFLIGLVVAIDISADWEYNSAIEIIAGHIFVLFVILFFVLTEFISYKKKNPVIKMKNTCIEFYVNNKVIYVWRNDNLENLIYKPFFINSQKPRNLLFWVAILFITFNSIILSPNIMYILLCFIVFQLIGNLLIKLLFCLILGKDGDIRFSFFPVLNIDIPHHVKGSFWGVSFGSYYMLTLFNKITYFETRKYFLAKYNIDINNVDKIYI